MTKLKLGAGAALASLMLAGCGTVGGQHEFGPIRPTEIPFIKPASAGPPTAQDMALHGQVVTWCNHVVTETRGTPLQAGIRRGVISAGTGAVSAEAGTEAWNAVGTAGKMAGGPTVAFYAALNGVYGGVNSAINYRDQNWNLVLTCTRDGEGASANGTPLVWYAPGDADNPNVSTAFSGTSEAPSSAPAQPPARQWPPAPNSGY